MNTYQLAAILTFGAASLCAAQTTGIQCVAEQTVFQIDSDGAQGPIASAGSMVAYTSGSDTLNLYDVSDLANPVLQSSTPGLCSNQAYSSQLVMTDSLIASSDFFDGVNIIDISDPTAPSLQANVPVQANYIAISGTNLIVHTGSGIEVYDISDPANPSLLDDIVDPSNPFGMVVIGTTVCVADRNAGLRLFDIADPANIVEASLYPHTSLVWSVAAKDQTAVLMTSSPNALSFIDVSDPYNPSLVQSSNVNLNVRSGGMFIDDTLALSTSLGVVLLDTTDPSSIQQQGVITGPDVLDRQLVTPLGADFAMISTKLFSIIDLPENGQLSSRIYNDNPISPSASLNGIFVDGDYAYSHDSNSNSLVVIDVSDPQNPTQAASYAPKATINSIQYQAGVVYLGLSSDLIEAVDVSNPLTPSSINSWSVSEIAIDLELGDNSIYAIAADGSIEVYDISSLQNPMLVSTIPSSTSNELTDICIRDDRMIRIDYSEGGGFSGNYMYVYDISDPSNPVALEPAPGGLGNLLPDYYAGGIQIDGHTLYITLGGYYHNGPSIYNGKFASYDIGNDVEPLDILTFQSLDSDFSDGAKLGQIMLEGNQAYVASRNTGGPLSNQSIALFDISDPANLEYIGASGVAEIIPTQSAAKSGDSIYLAGSGLAIFDASTDCATTCPADLTGNGMLDFFDVSVFLSAYNAQDPVADFTMDNEWNFFDVSAFLNAYSAGCP